MNAIQRPVVVPAAEVGIDCATRRQILTRGRPLATRVKNIHRAIDQLALINGPLVAAALGRRDQRIDNCPFLVRQVAGISKLASVVTAAVLGRPHQRLLQIGAGSRESQLAHPIQGDPGLALRQALEAGGVHPIVGADGKPLGISVDA